MNKSNLAIHTANQILCKKISNMMDKKNNDLPIQAIGELYNECEQNLSVLILEKLPTNIREIDKMVDAVVAAQLETYRVPDVISVPEGLMHTQINMKDYLSNFYKTLLPLSVNKLIGNMVDQSGINKVDSLTNDFNIYNTLIDIVTDKSYVLDLTTDESAIQTKEKLFKGIEECARLISDGTTCDGYSSYLKIASDECFTMLKGDNSIATIHDTFSCISESKFIEDHFKRILFAISNIPKEDLLSAYKIMSTRTIRIKDYKTWLIIRDYIFKPFHFVNNLRIFAVMILCCEEVIITDESIVISFDNIHVEKFYMQILRMYGISILPPIWRKNLFYANIKKIMNVY